MSRTLASLPWVLETRPLLTALRVSTQSSAYFLRPSHEPTGRIVPPLVVAVMDTGSEYGAEAELKAAAADGRAVRRGVIPTEHARYQTWDDDRLVRAEMLHELLLDPSARPRAVVLIGIRIVGRLNLESADVNAPLIFHGCRF